uniref:Coiled-coil-helix-coiled-coil-helix domain-containing protein 7 n=1 Tax=Ixodes ricinus TaxID=34613 RepID=A0A147BFC9_IXORI
MSPTDAGKSLTRAEKATSQDLNNPCLKEQRLSLKCLDDNGYDKKKCESFFVNYTVCQKFWVSSVPSIRPCSRTSLTAKGPLCVVAPVAPRPSEGSCSHRKFDAFPKSASAGLPSGTEFWPMAMIIWPVQTAATQWPMTGLSLANGHQPLVKYWPMNGHSLVIGQKTIASL